MEQHKNQALRESLEHIANYSKKYPNAPNLYPLFEFLGMDKFNALMRRARGRQIIFEIEYQGVNPVLVSYEILTPELQSA